ncbi:hypothetical protein B0H13DRAFT_1934133 [Mycena leptocephala]|nr:hypothetical protein B0H13DRAFT_1934133 [Mycena leptocephala]
MWVQVTLKWTLIQIVSQASFKNGTLARPSIPRTTYAHGKFPFLVLGSPKAEILGNMFCGQGNSLVNFLDADRASLGLQSLCSRTGAQKLYPSSSATRATSHCVAHTKSATTWLQWLLRNSSNTVMVNTSAYTEMKETGKGEDDDRDVRGPMLGARIGNLMRAQNFRKFSNMSRVTEGIFEGAKPVTKKVKKVPKTPFFARAARTGVFQLKFDEVGRW